MRLLRTAFLTFDLACIFALGGLCALLELLESRELAGDHVGEKGRG